LRGGAAFAAASLALLVAACGGRERAHRREEARTDERSAATAEGLPPDASLPSKTVKVYFPSSSGESLVTEDREIFETASPVDRAKQILAELLSGPTGEGAVAAVPKGTTLKQVYVLSDGTAYANFSSELSEGIGGSSDEILAIYSIVDSLALNVPEIRRVAILVDGKGRGTLAGHIDIRRPFRPDRDAG
jgi:spore germination protein GerM